MARRPDAGRGICKLAGLALGERDQILGAFHRQVVVHQEDGPGVAEDRNRREIADRVILEVGIERDIGRQRAGRIGHHQRMAVRRCVDDLLDRDGAAGAGAVVDDEGLACGPRDAIEYDASDNGGHACDCARNHTVGDMMGVVQRQGTTNGAR